MAPSLTGIASDPPLGRCPCKSVRAGCWLTETGLVLLMKIVGAGGEVWVTPAAEAIRPGEDPAEAAIRDPGPGPVETLSGA